MFALMTPQNYWAQTFAPWAHIFCDDSWLRSFALIIYAQNKIFELSANNFALSAIERNWYHFWSFILSANESKKTLFCAHCGHKLKWILSFYCLYIILCCAQFALNMRHIRDQLRSLDNSNSILYSYWSTWGPSWSTRWSYWTTRGPYSWTFGGV